MRGAIIGAMSSARRDPPPPGPQEPRPEAGAPVVRLSFRRPYDIAAMTGFLARRAIAGVEVLEGDAPDARYWRTLAVTAQGRCHAGWISVCFDDADGELELRTDPCLGEVLPTVVRRVRSAFDLDADPAAIDAVLAADFPDSRGLRVPGAFDGFELAVRAVLGQQVTVAAARTIGGRLVARFGRSIDQLPAGLARLFPDAATLACAAPAALGEIGIVRQRQAAIIALAQAVEGGDLVLEPGVDPAATMDRLRALPGIGAWTAQYIAMRALDWPDAFPAGDVALHRALGLARSRGAAAAAEAASQKWRPWRSYAVLRAWHAGAPPARGGTVAPAAGDDR